MPLFRLKFDPDEYYDKFWHFKKRADKFMISRGGTFFRFGAIATIVSAYPLTKILLNGPLLNLTFSKRYNITKDLPDHLKNLIDQQSFIWLEKEGGSEESLHFRFNCQQDARHSLDSIRIGSMAALTGAQIALPFYAQFQTTSEALEYIKKHLEPFNILGKTTQIDWESEKGRQLLSTFVLSPEALAFLVVRDLYAVQSSYILMMESLTWFCYVFVYMSCFFFLHMIAFNGDSLVFLAAFPFVMGISIFSAIEWNKLGIYFNEHHANYEASNLSKKHTKGGREYYSKFLQRNRILRDIVGDGDKMFTKIGDLKSNVVKYTGFYSGVDEINSENEELTVSIGGDDIDE